MEAGSAAPRRAVSTPTPPPGAPRGKPPPPPPGRKALGAAAGNAHALPRGQEARQRHAVDRLDLLAEDGQRTPPQCLQDLFVTPLPLDAVGPELAPDDPALALERLQGEQDRLGPHPQ